MEKFLKKLKYFKEFLIIFLASIGLIFTSVNIIKKKAIKVDEIKSPEPFIRDKKNDNIIKIRKNNIWSEVVLPEGMKNKDVKAVQNSSYTNGVKVKVKHEKINFSNIDNGNNSNTLDI